MTSLLQVVEYDAFISGDYCTIANKPDQLVEQLHITMKSLTPALQHHILSLPDSGLSGYQISSQTGVSNATVTRLLSKHCPSLQKSSGGHPTKLSESKICHAIHHIGSGRGENAVQVTKALRDVFNQPISTQIQWLKKPFQCFLISI